MLSFSPISKMPSRCDPHHLRLTPEMVDTYVDSAWRELVLQTLGPGLCPFEVRGGCDGHFDGSPTAYRSGEPYLLVKPLYPTVDGVIREIADEVAQRFGISLVVTSCVHLEDPDDHYLDLDFPDGEAAQKMQAVQILAQRLLRYAQTWR